MISTKNRNGSGRLENLDALKAISITLVVFCHYVLLSKGSIAGNAVMSAAWGAVPCFMMVSGALLHSKRSFSWGYYFNKLIKIIVPFILWRLIYLLITAMVSTVECSFSQVVQYLFFFKDIDSVSTGGMWYIIAYIVVLLLYPVTYHLFRDENGRKVLLFMCILACLSGVIIPSINWGINKISAAMGRGEVSVITLNMLMPFNNYANMLFYFILGAFIFDSRDSIKEFFSGRRYITIAAVIAGVAGLMSVKYIDNGTWRWENLYILDGYTRCSTAVLSIGLFLFFLVYDFKKIYHILAVSLGRYTMGIYYIHPIALFACYVTVYPYLTDYSSFTLNCVKTIIMLAFSASVTMLLRAVPGLKRLVV